MSVSLDAGLASTPQSRRSALLSKVWRYGLSTSGPVATSGAHFLASLLFVRGLSAHDFGLFSFVLVIVPFAMSMMGALLVIPVTRALSAPADERAAITAACMKMNLLLSLAAALAIFALLLTAHTPIAAAMALALFGGTFTYRWFVRCQAYVEGRVAVAVASDLAYAACLIAGLALMALSHTVTLLDGAACLLVAATAGLLPFGPKLFSDQVAALFKGRLRLYASTFRDVTRWSLLGVIFTEMTVNAHAYLVTLLAGAGPFALLALGMLLMRPASLVQSALPDLERPVMTRQIAARDWKSLNRTRREFGAALLGVLMLTIALDAALLYEFPALLLEKGYGARDVIIVGTICAIIMAIRALRTPVAVQLQAAGIFRELAVIGLKSGIISIIVTLGLLLSFGPIVSMGGVLMGEIAILYFCYRMLGKWQADNV